MSVSIEIKVRYSETDMMGIAHHSRYYVWFEEARTELYRKSGYSYREMEKMGLFMPVIETQCKYKKPVTFEDEIIVTAETSYLKGATHIVNYTIIKRDTKEIVAEGMTKHALANKELKPINPRKVFPEILKAMEERM